MSLTTRRVMLVPLPAAVQHLFTFTSDHLPTLTLLGFVIIQFVLNVLHYIPAKYWRRWVERTRLVLKGLLDPDYRVDHYQLELLRQRVADCERDHSSVVPSQSSDGTLSLAESNRNLKTQLLLLSKSSEQRQAELSAEVAKFKARLEETQKTLEETEGLLETYRKVSSSDGKRVTSDEKKGYLEQIAALEGKFVQSSKERKALGEEIASLKEAHKSLQTRVKNLGDANMNLLTEKESLAKEVESLKTRESQLVASRDQFLGRLNTELQSSARAKEELEGLKARLEAAEGRKGEAEKKASNAEGKLKIVESERETMKKRAEEAEDRVRTLEMSGSRADVSAEKKGDNDAEKKHLQELESELSGGHQLVEDLKKELEVKNDEINRLKEALEHAQRHHKLIKPRHRTDSGSHSQHQDSIHRQDSTGRPQTPPPTSQLTPPSTLSHFRSNSLSSRLGFGGDRERRVSTGGSVKGYDISPKKEKVPLPGPSGTPEKSREEGVVADASMASTVGTTGSTAFPATSPAKNAAGASSTLAPPAADDNGGSIGRHGRKKSRQRLSSFLGIHMGTPEKEK